MTSFSSEVKVIKRKCTIEFNSGKLVFQIDYDIDQEETTEKVIQGASVTKHFCAKNTSPDEALEWFKQFLLHEVNNRKDIASVLNGFEIQIKEEFEENAKWMKALQGIYLGGNGGNDFPPLLPPSKCRKISCRQNYFTAKDLITLKDIICGEHPADFDTFTNLMEVQVFDCSVNSIQAIPKTFWSSICPSTLSELYLSNNAIKVIDLDMLTYFPQLEVLDLRQNSLTTFEIPHGALPLIRYLSLSNNNLQRLCCTTPLISLKTFCIFGNSKVFKKDLMEFLSCAPNLERLVAGATPLLSWPNPPDEQKKVILSLLPNLKFLESLYVGSQHF